MKQFKKIVLIVMDSLGVGEAKNAKEYNDEGAFTLKHIIDNYPDLKIPNLEKLGFRHFLGESVKPQSILSTLEEASVGKDTLTGHFEMMGLYVDTPFPSFTDTWLSC